MPTLAAAALDRLLDPGASRSLPAADLDSRTGGLATYVAAPNGGDAKSVTRRNPAVPHPKLGRRNSTPVETETRRASQWPQISPALYATPEARPLPDSPDSVSPSVFPSSPYVINHKRRGPRLMKSLSEQNVSSKVEKEEKSGDALVVGNGHLSDTEVVSNGHLGDTDVTVKGSVVVEEVKVNGFHGREIPDGEKGNGAMGGNGEVEAEGEAEDFFDPQESLSYTSNTDVEDNNNAERSGKMGTPGGEFFDAWEELSSDSGRHSKQSIYKLEGELREMRLSMLMEIERRKQAEEASINMRNQWQNLREKMKKVGLVLPPDSFNESGEADTDTAEEICRQIHLTRYVSECIGIEVAKAEAKAEMEVHLEAKNFEIARLNDRLHYYETVNREMSQRNQEAIERARHDRQKRKRRLRWLWGSVGIAITVGSLALAWSYTPVGKVVPSSADLLQAAEADTAADCVKSPSD